MCYALDLKIITESNGKFSLQNVIKICGKRLVIQKRDILLMII